MAATVPGRRNPALDLWLAMLAGDRVWLDRNQRASTRERGVAAVMIASLAMVVVVQWVAIGERVELFADRPATDGQQALVLIGGATFLAICLLAYRPIRVVKRMSNGSAGFTLSVMWRAVAYVVVIAGTAATVTSLRFLSAVPVGVLGGADALLALWAIGVAPEPMRWLRRFVFSTIHFGALGAMLATSLLGAEPPAQRATLGLYVAMWVGLGVSATVALAIHRLSELADAQHAADRAEIAAAERARRAHWLHDDVLSEVRLASLRIDSGTHTPDQTRRELQELDHRLRLRQLDEMMRGGTPHIYQILQPHLRRAQTLGIVLSPVPPLEVSERTVDEETGHVVHRVVSVLMSNAINAGATRLGIVVEARDDIGCLVLRVIDNAGGFDLAALPPGRGLSSLARDLGPDSISRTDAPDGSSVNVCVPIARTGATDGIHEPATTPA